MFCAALFCVSGDFLKLKTEGRRKTSPQSCKTQIKILLFPGLAQLGSEQPGPGATLLGWPKSIYYSLPHI